MQAPDDRDYSGHLIMETILWYFFTLLNAFYGGALTMFFTTTLTLPFETETDVILAYPDWKLMFMDGMEALFYTPAVQGDRVYQTYWDRVQVINA